MNEDALPGGWVWTSISGICDLINGRAFKPDEWSTHGLPIIRIQNLNNLNTDFNYCNFEVVEKYLVNNGQLLFAWSGTPGTSFGAHIWNRGKAVLNQHIFKIEINESYINKIFLMYLINRNIDEYIRKAHGTAGLAHITKNKFENSIIPLPPLPEQRRIVTKIEEMFTKLDAGVSALKKTQTQLKRYRQSVLKAACEGKLVPTEAELAKAEGRAYEPAEVLLARILKERREKAGKGAKYKETAAPDTNGLPLPEGWSWANVGQMTDSMKNGIYKPREFYTEDGFACLRMYNIDGGKIVWKDIKRMNLTKEEIGEFLLLPGDLLVNRVNSRELVGKAAVIPPGIERCVFESKNIRVRVLDEIVNPYYLCYRFTSVGTEYFNRNAQQVVGMASISQPQISRFPVPLPPLAEQRRIVAEVERRLSVADEVAGTVEQSLAQAQRLRQSILKKAFEGKLVAQDASDEPAGVLVERIRQQKQIKEKNNKTTKRKIHG